MNASILITLLQSHTCATTPNAPKLSIFSGHDSSVGPLLSVFGVFNNRFPPFGSVVSFEQFEEMATKTGIPPVSPHQRHYNISKSFIRMSYNGDPVIIPHCALPGNHRQDDKTLCRLEAFFDHADSMIPKNYEKECESV